MTIDDIYERLQHLEEHIAEFGAEMANERAMFGDSGPGTQLRLNELRAAAARLRRMIDVIQPGFKARFNVTREQWQKTWRDARVIRSNHREPKIHTDKAELVWYAFNLVDSRPWHHAPAIQRLQWRRNFDDLDIPF